MRAFECSGLWWLPDQERRVAGTLSISADGQLDLSLTDSLDPADNAWTDKSRAAIFGSVTGPLDHEITLSECHLTGWQTGTFVGTPQRFRANRAFFGAHLSDPTAAMFRRSRFRIGGLDDWTRPLSGLRHQMGRGSRPGETVALLNYVAATPVGGPITGGAISLGLNLHYSGNRSGDHFSERAGLVVTTEQPLAVGPILAGYADPLQDLMTFVCGRAQELEEVSVWRDGAARNLEDNPKIRVIGSRVTPVQDESDDNRTHPNDFLIELADLGDGFPPFIDRWLRLSTTYAEACNLYFALDYGPPAYLDFTFQGVTTALVLFYTRRHDGAAGLQADASRLAGLLGTLAPDDADWLRRITGERPFPPLRHVLNTLANEHAETLALFPPTSAAVFVESAAATAEYFSRRDPETAANVARGADLYRLLMKARILWQLCLLRELGFTPEQSRGFFVRNERYRHLRQKSTD